MREKGARVGILANEFFEGTYGDMGGFGWAAKRAMEAFEAEESPVEEVVLLAGQHFKVPDGVERVHGQRIIKRSARRARDVIRHLRAPVDVILSIDFRPSYLPWFKVLPFTPVVVWVRDPRTQEDWDRIRTLRVPGGADASPGGIGHIDTRSLASFAHKTRFLRRPLLLANKMAYLGEKIPGTYGLDRSSRVLCNPDVVDYERVEVAKSERPRVVFLGRLDPIKRPWLFVELARRFPDVEFLMLGQRHVDGALGWDPEEVPANLRLLGHVGGQQKYELLSSAWVLVNTSIHEESAVSQFEALAYETPLLSCIDSDRIAERYGVFTGRFDGTGLEALPKLEEGLERLVIQHEWRRELGRRGRQFVREAHNTPQFLRQFEALYREAKAGRGSASRLDQSVSEVKGVSHAR